MKKTFNYESAQAVLIFDETKLEGRLVNVKSEVTGQGHARGVLQMAVDYADKHRMDIRLRARQYGNPRGLTNPQLVEFYSKFGFVKVGDTKPVAMFRPYSRESQGL